ncbi:MAG: MFS transporter [Pseudomonadota bacterium]|nr:MFS transporter [Pseudomonadota bacterium]
MIRLLATACGLIVANLYYAQPLTALISQSIGLGAEHAGLITTFTQLGYGAGLIFIAPLGDLIENRRLVVAGLALTTTALLAAWLSHSALSFLLAALFIGLGSVVAQVIVPFAAHLTVETQRGHVVGKVMTGLLLGIMLARPAASLIAGVWGWHAVFLASALATGSLAIALAGRLPRRDPAATTRYPQLLSSMWHLLTTTPVLQRRALYHACLFGAFSLFWTTVPLLLTGPIFGLSQLQLAAFALVGVAGAIAAPIAGRMADRGKVRSGTLLAMSAVAAAFALTLIGTPGSRTAVLALCAAAVLLDMGVAANLVFGQREIFVLGAAMRGRLNGLYMAIFFLGGALGSSLGAWCFAHHGWVVTAALGAGSALVALAFALTEARRRPALASCTP